MRFVARSGGPLNGFGILAESIARGVRAESAILDGEIAVPHKKTGRTLFAKIEHREEARSYAFDLLWLNGQDLCAPSPYSPVSSISKFFCAVVPRGSSMSTTLWSMAGNCFSSPAVRISKRLLRDVLTIPIPQPTRRHCGSRSQILATVRRMDGVNGLTGRSTVC